MKQIKRLKRGKISLFLAAAVLSLGILSGCGAESKEAKEARMTGIEQLNAGLGNASAAQGELGNIQAQSQVAVQAETNGSSVQESLNAIAST